MLFDTSVLTTRYLPALILECKHKRIKGIFILGTALKIPSAYFSLFKGRGRTLAVTYKA